MPGERYFEIRDRLSELLDWVGDFAREVSLEDEPDHPRPVLSAPVLIAAIGEVNAGKSSLLNALAGEEICPVGNLPLTSQVRLYRHGAVADREASPMVVECRRPLDYLKRFNLLDTPGTNSKHEGHREAAQPFLEHADLVLVVFTAENPWTAATWDAVSRLSPEALARTALVVQRVDLKQAQDIPVILGHMRDLSLKRLGRTLPIFPVSARMALEAKRADPPDPGLRAGGRIAELEHFITGVICESYGRRQLLHDAWHHSARTLRRLDQKFDAQQRGTDDDSWFLAGLDREIEAQRDAALEVAPAALAEVMERYQAEAGEVVDLLKRRLGWWPSLARMFGSDGVAGEVEAAFASRMQETARSFGRENGARLVDACAVHWETVHPRVAERMGIASGPCAVAGEAREAVVEKIVKRLEKAVPRALAGLRLRGVLAPLLRRRDSLLKGFVGVGLALLLAAGLCGTFFRQPPALALLAAAAAVFGAGVIACWLTRRSVAESYRERLIDMTSAFAEGIRADHGEAIRSVFHDYSQSLIDVRRRLAEERIALLPRMERANSLYIALKSIELDL